MAKSWAFLLSCTAAAHKSLPPLVPLPLPPKYPRSYRRRCRPLPPLVPLPLPPNTPARSAAAAAQYPAPHACSHQHHGAHEAAAAAPTPPQSAPLPPNCWLNPSERARGSAHTARFEASVWAHFQGRRLLVGFRPASDLLQLSNGRKLDGTHGTWMEPSIGGPDRAAWTGLDACMYARNDEGHVHDGITAAYYSLRPLTSGRGPATGNGHRNSVLRHTKCDPMP